jgi:hypothetical protein
MTVDILSTQSGDFWVTILTPRLIETAACPPGRQQVILRCGDLKGFGLRITNRGCRSFVVEHRINGAMTRITIAKVGSITLDEDRDKARAILKEMAAGRHPKQQEPVITLREVLEEYLRVRNLRPSSRRAYRNVTRQRLGDWLDLPVTDITRQMVLQRHWEITKALHELHSFSGISLADIIE